jgi:hypothetical protein
MDGCFLSKSLTAIFGAGEQAKVPLLEGSNTQEQSARSVLGTSETLRRRPSPAPLGGFAGIRPNRC